MYTRDTDQEGEDEAGWRPHSPWLKPHLEENSIEQQLPSKSMAITPATTLEVAVSFQHQSSILSLSPLMGFAFWTQGLSLKFELRGCAPPASTMAVLGLGCGSGPRGPTATSREQAAPPLVQPAATVRSSPTLSGVPPRPACVPDLVLGPMENLSATCQCGLFGQTGVMRWRLPPCFKFNHPSFAHPNFVLDMK